MDFAGRLGFRGYRLHDEREGGEEREEAFHAAKLGWRQGVVKDAPLAGEREWLLPHFLTALEGLRECNLVGVFEVAADR